MVRIFLVMLVWSDWLGIFLLLSLMYDGYFFFDWLRNGEVRDYWWVVEYREKFLEVLI